MEWEGFQRVPSQSKWEGLPAPIVSQQGKPVIYLISLLALSLLSAALAAPHDAPSVRTYTQRLQI